MWSKWQANQAPWTVIISVPRECLRARPTGLLMLNAEFMD